MVIMIHGGRTAITELRMGMVFARQTLPSFVLNKSRINASTNAHNSGRHYDKTLPFTTLAISIASTMFLGTTNIAECVRRILAFVFRLFCFMFSNRAVVRSLVWAGVRIPVGLGWVEIGQRPTLTEMDTRYHSKTTHESPNVVHTFSGMFGMPASRWPLALTAVANIARW